MRRSVGYLRAASAHPEKVKVVVYGVGAIGLAVIREALRRESLHLIGALDRDPQKVGRDLAVGGTDVRVTDSPEILKQARVVVHTTGSSLKDIYPQLVEILEAGASVISSCEEMAFPHLQNPDLARDLDRLARARNTAAFGTGVNPGFVLDVLPVVVTSVMTEVRRVTLTRVVDATTRRGPLQKKIGSGLTPETFERLAHLGKIGHVGLVESVALIAHCLNWPLDSISETLEPVVTREAIRTDHVCVQPGQVAGLHQVAEGLRNGDAVIRSDLVMRLNAHRPHDAMILEGTPTLNLSISDGTAGDPATVAALLNAIPRVLLAPPGLLTAMDLVLPRACA